MGAELARRRPQQYDATCFRRDFCQAYIKPGKDLRHGFGPMAGVDGIGESQFLKPQIGDCCNALIAIRTAAVHSAVFRATPRRRQAP